MTIHRTYIPQPPLSAFVHMFWLYEGQQQHARERRLPDGSMELVINLREDTLRVYDRQHHDQFQSFRGGLISGAHSEFIVLDTTCLASIIGIHFKPGGAFPFLTLPAGELHDEIVSLETLWGATASDLREQLLEASTPETRFRILEQYLLARAARPLARHPAVAFALKEFQIEWAEIALTCGYFDQAHCIHDFRAFSGLNPTAYLTHRGEHRNHVPLGD